MADLAILTGINNGGFDSAIIPDTLLEINHNMSNEVTSYPISTGTDGTDNARVRNNEIIIRGLFGDLSFKSNPHRFRDVEDLVSTETATTDPLATAAENPIFITRRRQEAFNLLKRARDQKQTIDLVTDYIVYNDCLITNFNVVESREFDQVLSFSLSFVQLRFAEVIATLNVNVVESIVDSASGETFGTNIRVQDVPTGEFESAIGNVLSTTGEALISGFTP